MVARNIANGWVVLTVALVVLPCQAWSQAANPAAEDRMVSGRSWNTREMKIEQALDREADFDYFETRFGDVVAELSNDYRIPIVIDESCHEYDMDEETLITLQLSDVSLAAGLNIMLKPHECTWAIRDEVLYIMSQDAESELLSIRVYDCQNLAARIGGNQPVYEDLVTVIRTTVNPESWQTNGGPAGIAEIAGRLVVNQNSDAHRKINGLLNGLGREMEDPVSSR